MKINLQLILILLLGLFSISSKAKEYIIYSVSQDIPMGYKNEKIYKNYYVNMGKNQGLNQGTTLNVFRVISRLDPYKAKKRYNYRVKIGELTVLYSEDDSSITKLLKIDPHSPHIYFEIPSFMIGDHIEVKVN